MKILFLILIVSLSVFSKDFTLKEVGELLQKEGLTGLVHGIDTKRDFYMFTWSNPESFFNRFNLAMTSEEAELKTKFKSLKRGDKIWIAGKMDVNNGQPHLILTDLKVLREYRPQIEAPAGEHRREVNLPKDLENKNSITATVHANEAKGRAVVLEYKDAIIPLIARNRKYTQDLYRGDYIKVRFKLGKSAQGKPTHLKLDTSNVAENGEPIVVLDSLKSHHGKVKTVTGRLVLFPKSPTINMDVWAVEFPGPGGANRFYTIVNFVPNSRGELEELAKIGKKLRADWDKYAKHVFKGRNKYINTGLNVTVTGKMTVVATNQANAQLHTTVDQVETSERRD